jgi:GTP pyrophosphokinase
MARTTPDRVIAVAWGERSDAATAAYPVDVQIEATDRQGLLRDISEIFAREKMNVIAVNTRSVRDTDGDTAQMTFTIEVADATRLNPALRQINAVSGVRGARRRR